MKMSNRRIFQWRSIIRMSIVENLLRKCVYFWAAFNYTLTIKDFNGQQKNTLLINTKF